MALLYGDYLASSKTSGDYQIVGTTSRLGVPGGYKVRLFDRRSGLLLREVFSSPSGEYLFDRLAYSKNGYFTVAIDHSGSPVNAAISDLLTPVLMP
jgi:hypothetical protein